MASHTLPTLPVPLTGLVKHIEEQPERALTELFEPYRKYEAALRQVFAQDPANELLKDPYVNVLPVFTENTPGIKIRARKLETESKEEKSKYIMPLPAHVRRPDGSPAVVQSFREFQRNFNVFSESSLVELDWSNVVAAGSSVVNCLLPVPDDYSRSKRGLREFYHEKFCPASDVDLFLYGLTEEEAIEKIKDIEARVRDALLTETTVVRTKHAITICSQYPTRHIQIVLRIYKSVSEILAGFDIDCSGAAYDGKQVYCTPRALQSYLTQINHIDLTRRSPSYENRLSKYSHRGFEVYWPDLDRSRVDPTIFERSFQGTRGLARLLVLERLPTSSARDRYMDERRRERGRPPINRYRRHLRSLAGNIKEEYEDEVADWLFEDDEDISNYHTFTVPYGPKFHAKRIEKLCYTRDLLLNAEWNQHEFDRDVYLHRHPAFFGRAEDVIHDCCGYCPVPETEEEKAVAEEDARVFVSGTISFIKDDPGRQQIGSFSPLTDDDWTEMAYVGDTARLCQAVVDADLDYVKGWLAQEGTNPDTRDYTGRTPLHLATMSSTPDVVRALVDAGARLVARLADGRTALHLAAARGDVELIKILLEKSAANEAEYEEKKQDQRRREKNSVVKTEAERVTGDKSDDEQSDGELIGDDDSDAEARTMATGSFVQVGSKRPEQGHDAELEGDEEDEEPDFYDINVVAWDAPCSALHFAIIEGHVEVVKMLVQEYGADVLLPVKFNDGGADSQGALLTLVLALALPVEQAKEMARTLLDLGATSAQADMNGVTAFQRFVEEGAETLLDMLWEADPTGAKTATSHIAFRDYHTCQTALQVAVQKGNAALVRKLLDHGAAPHIDFETWLKSAKRAANMENSLGTFEANQKRFKEMVEQPLIHALNSPCPETALELLERGADPNAVTRMSQYYINATWYSRFSAESALDVANKQLEALREYNRDSELPARPGLPEGMDSYLGKFEEGTYQHMIVSRDIASQRKRYRRDLKQYEAGQSSSTSATGATGAEEKAAAIEKATRTMERVKEALLAKGAKTFAELHPELKDRLEPQWDRSRSPGAKEKKEPYKFVFSFRNVKDVTEARKEAYLKLFNAAWNGDLETVKTLTLTSWDDAKQEAPLKIAVHDQQYNNPFSLAFDRRHYDVAKAVLEIARAQYSPEEKPKTRYRMKGAGRDSVCSDEVSSCSDDESAEEDDARPAIYGQLVGQQLTIDNVGEVSMKVDSHTKPLEMVAWSSSLSSAISRNDMEQLKQLLEICERWSAEKLDPDDEVSGFYAFPDGEFKRAVELGRVELLGEIIKRTGAGLPLEDLVKDTGLELQIKPTYYQGLTVYGKKRKDWATAGRSMVIRQTGSQISPLLLAAMAGQLESVEWFLSDTPLRLYLAFARSKAARNDVRLKHLAEAPGGLDAAISKWLSDQSELVLHAAISATPGKMATELVSYLARTRPSLLEVKNANGVTPLLLACRLGRLDAVKTLIDAGADQAVKDRGRNNVLHTALANRPDAAQLGALLRLLDRAALVPMLKERNKLEHGGRTPLHIAVPRPNLDHANEAIRLFRLLCELSPDTIKQALRMLDGAGDTPLHVLLASNADPAVVCAVLDFDPDLLCCENAVGRTPAEVAHDRYLAEIVQSPRQRSYYQPDNSVSTLVSMAPRQFVKDPDPKAPAREHEPRTAVAEVWRLCAETMARTMGGPPKRSLVSLHAANFVAKRLGERHASDRYKFQLEKEREDGDEGDEGEEVSSQSLEDSTSASNGEGAAYHEHEKAKAPAAKPPTGPAATPTRRRRADVITPIYAHHPSAWARPKKEKATQGRDGEEDSDNDSDEEEEEEKEQEEEDDSEDDEKSPMCSKCHRRHC